MKVSIITVTYNSAETLHKTIDSVLQQTYQDIDYWIIDGKSTDQTMEIVKSYAASFGDKLHYLSEPDNGIYDAMNKGIRLCNGDVVGFLNSDDWFTRHNVIEKIVGAFVDNVDAVYGDIHIVNRNDPSKQIYRQSGRIFRPFLLGFGVAPPHPSFYVRKSLLHKYGVFNTIYKISGDFDLMARLIHKYKIKTKYIHTDCVTMTAGGTSTRDHKAYLKGLDEIFLSCKNLGITTSKNMLSLRKHFIMLENRV